MKKLAITLMLVLVSNITLANEYCFTKSGYIPSVVTVTNLQGDIIALFTVSNDNEVCIEVDGYVYYSVDGGSTNNAQSNNTIY